jgi:hypothetical protein
MKIDDAQRNDGLHPRHPGRGKCSVIEIESADNEPEFGGFIIFLPSGSTKTVHWRQAKPIQPTLDAAKDFTAQIVESLMEQGGSNDVGAVNWTSVAAAVQRVILDWNGKIVGKINSKMVRDMADGKMVGGTGHRDKRRVH